MAELTATPEPWTASQSQAQYIAIAWLRWRILLNGFRGKGGRGDLVARIVSIPLIGILMLAPTLGAGYLAWYFAVNTNLGHMSWLLWGIFVLSQMVNLNLGRPGTTFDPTELIRFPMRLRNYVTIRLFFGILSPGNVVAAVMSIAAWVGVSIALPHLWLLAGLALAVFALTNVIFTRMVFSWVDRWMSTRRAREIFTALVFVISLGAQYLQVNFNPAFSGHHRSKHFSSHQVDVALRFYDEISPVLSNLPPGLTANALIQADRRHVASTLVPITGCALFAAGFLAVFALRMRTEFGGENLSDDANGVSKKVTVPVAASQLNFSTQASPAQQRNILGLSPTVFIVLGKEFLYLRRNSGVFYGLVAPLVMVLLFASKLASRGNHWVFPAALAYTLLGLAPFAYNSFGLEGPGTQFYFLAPIRLRDVILAKNFMNFMMALGEGVAVLGIVTYLGSPPTNTVIAATLLWTIGTLLFNMTVGNLRSISSPKKINLNRTAGKQASPLSALIGLGVLLVASAIGAGFLFLSNELHLQWLLLPAAAMYAAIGIAVYLAGLRAMNSYALNHRESMFEELCKQS